MVSYSFERLADFMELFGILDFLLPFLLVFTIVFAVLRKTHILGTRKSFDVIVSLVIGLLFVVPHLIGFYPLGYDPVLVLNETLPSIALIAVAAIMLLILMGMFGANFAAGSAPFIAIVAIIFIIYVFGASLGFWDSPNILTNWVTPEVIEIVLIILVFGIIVYFITREPRSIGGDIMRGLHHLFDRRQGPGGGEH